MNQTIENLEPQPSRTPPPDHISNSVTAILNTLSILFFSLTFSSLTHLLSSWCNRLLAEK